MRILIVTHYLGDAYPHGIERVVTSLAWQLRAAGDDVMFATTIDPWPRLADGENVRLSAAGFPVAAVSPGELSPIGEPVEEERWRAELEQVLLRFRPELVLITLLHGLHPDAVAFIKGHGIPVVLDLHSYEAGCPRLLLYDAHGQPCRGPNNGERCASVCFPDLVSARTLVAARNERYARAMRAADARVACSPTVARWVQEQCDCDEITVVAPPVAPLAFDPAPPAQGERAVGLRIATIGGVGPAKGSHIAVEGVRHARLDACELLMFGPIVDPGLAASLRRQAAEMAGVRLSILGTFQPDELDVLLGGVDALVIASQSPETYSIAAREAWCRGIPVIASAVGALTDAVEHGVNGFLFAHDDPQCLGALLRQLARDAGLRARLRSGALATPVSTAEEHAMTLRSTFARLVGVAESELHHAGRSGAPTSRAACADPRIPPCAVSPAAFPLPPEGVPASDSHRLVFTSIYANEFWRRGGESSSGPGSRRESTKRLRSELPQLISRLRVKRMLDIGCGDFNWMREMQLDLELYIGVDTVFEVVLANRLQYGDLRRRFLMRDLTQHPLPRADLVLCRDVLIHFPDADLVVAMQAILDSGAHYLLASTFVERDRNDPIALGDWRPVNLELAPLRLLPPMAALVETPPEPGYDDKRLGLWDLDAMRTGTAAR